MRTKSSRRNFLRLSASASLASFSAASFSDSGRHRQPTVGAVNIGIPLLYHSPPLTPYVDALPIPPLQPIGGTVAIKEALHQFHRDLAPARSWGYAGASHLGPTFIAHKGTNPVTVFENQMREHIFAPDIDLSHEGTDPLDLALPPVSMHLHGAPNPPEFDGHPMDLFRPGETKSYVFNNSMEATTLWLHDHAMGNTRLNVYGGLATQYWVRDEWDTGEPTNPLGLPSGEYEIPLTIQDKMFFPDGMPRYYATPTVRRSWWQGGFCGDVMCVNGKVWPDLKVKRGLYRFRLLNGAPLNTYTFYFSNKMPFYVIGNDGGLLDAPVKVQQLTVGCGERYDLLVDFSQQLPGEQIELLNDEQIVWPGQMLGSKMIPNIMRFTVLDETGLPGVIPEKLRGGSGFPTKLPALPKPDSIRDITLNWLLAPRIPFSDMNINNVGYMDEEIEMPEQGSVEQWNFINNSPWDHTLHIHLVQFRILGRTDFAASLYKLTQAKPKKGVRWAPSAERYTFGRPMQAPKPEESGWKDTVRCPPGQITRIIVRFPTEQELGFDPDRTFGSSQFMSPLQGYSWHCHILDHEDHEMMLRYRLVRPGTNLIVSNSKRVELCIAPNLN